MQAIKATWISIIALCNYNHGFNVLCIINYVICIFSMVLYYDLFLYNCYHVVDVIYLDKNDAVIYWHVVGPWARQITLMSIYT